MAGRHSTLETDDVVTPLNSTAHHMTKYQPFGDVTTCDSGVSLSFRDDSVTSLTENVVKPRDDVAMDTAVAMQGLQINDVTPSRKLEDLFAQDDDGDTKLHLAVIQPHVAAATWLIASALAYRPSFLDVQNYEFRQTALHVAVVRDLPTLVRTLVVAGAEVELRDRHGNTALHLACQRAKTACIEALTRPVSDSELNQLLAYCQSVQLPVTRRWTCHCPDLSARDYEGRSYLHLLQQLTTPNRLEIIDYLITNCSADVNVQDGKSGYTLLHLAVKQNDRQLFSYLLNVSSLDVNLLTYSRLTALDIADSLSRVAMATKLVTANAQHSIDFHGNDSSSESDEEQMDDYDDIVVAGQRLNLNKV